METLEVPPVPLAPISTMNKPPAE
jgi:hypothetical protein